MMWSKIQIRDWIDYIQANQNDIVFLSVFSKDENNKLILVNSVCLDCDDFVKIKFGFSLILDSKQRLGQSSMQVIKFMKNTVHCRNRNNTIWYVIQYPAMKEGRWL
jgi:hypothetical protein